MNSRSALFKLVFVLLLLVLLFYGYFILLYVYFILFYVVLYYSIYYFILLYVTFECTCVQTTAIGYLPNCSWQYNNDMYQTRTWIPMSW
jgi:hypothetical protein